MAINTLYFVMFVLAWVLRQWRIILYNHDWVEMRQFCYANDILDERRRRFLKWISPKYQNNVLGDRRITHTEAHYTHSMAGMCMQRYNNRISNLYYIDAVCVCVCVVIIPFIPVFFLFFSALILVNGFFPTHLLSLGRIFLQLTCCFISIFFLLYVYYLMDETHFHILLLI